MFLTLVCHCKVGALGVSDASVSLEHRIGLVAFRHDVCYTMIVDTLVDFFLDVYHEPKVFSNHMYIQRCMRWEHMP